MNSICVNTDISGIGVRTATYAQNLLSFLPAFWALLDGQVDENELATLETQSTTILLSAFALLFSTIIQAQTQGLDSFHATIVLNLSWMNNTNTFIYMLLLLHRKIWTTPPSEWTARSVARVIFGPKQKSAHLSADAERQSPSAKPISTNSLRTWSEWIPFDHVILIGAAHLSLMGALGIWVWIHPGTFGISASCPAGSVSLFAHNIPIESSALRTFSLLVYGVVLLPYFNLILPVALIFGPYFGYLLHKTEKSADELRNAAAAWGVRTGLLVLFVINVFFMVDTELSIARNEGHQNADGVWTFGQTLALILLLLPLRDAVENILQRSEKRVQRRLSLNAAISNFKLYQDRVPWKKVEEWVTEIESANASVEPHQLWLRRASAQNKIEIVRFLLKHGVDAEDEVYPRRDNGPPKHTENNNPTLSAQNMKKKLVRGLVRKTDKKDQTSPAGVSPDENDIPAFLTEKVFNANDEDVSTKSADQYASEYRHVDIVCLLLKEIVNARGTKNDGCTLLHLAVQKGYAETVRVLVEKGADINVREYDGKAPLHLATEKGLAKIVGLLVENGADINVRNYRKQAPLHLAVENGLVEIVHLLVQKGADINVREDDGNTPLLLASEQGLAEIVHLLVEKGADVNVRDYRKKTPLHLAVENGLVEIVHLLVQKGADINVRENDGSTPLYLAAQKGLAEIVRLLVEKGTDINIRGRRDETPLHAAARNTNSEIPCFLLESGADINATDEFGDTPLHVAESGETVRLLVDRGADINVCNNYGRNPLHLAALRGRAEISRFFVERGADVNTAAKDGWTPVHCASWSGNPEDVRFLVGKGADINARTKGSETALHFASQNGSTEIVRFLVKKGADINARDSYGETPLQVAKVYPHSDIVSFLEAHGGVSG